MNGLNLLRPSLGTGTRRRRKDWLRNRQYRSFSLADMAVRWQ